mmetsp:Transcript_63576/g.201053  ORF Transcript_63576/g.201053 Transcript_63576/m.201053 type:complete len:295 (+) Transcript_63576:143-1027(+)
MAQVGTIRPLAVASLRPQAGAARRAAPAPLGLGSSVCSLAFSARASSGARRNIAVVSAKAKASGDFSTAAAPSVFEALSASVEGKGESRMNSVSPAALAAFPLASMYMGDLSSGLGGSVQLLYLGGILTLLGGAGYLIVRQVLIRRELDEAAKELGERVRSGGASSEELFEYGVVMLRKKVFTQSIKYLEEALQTWDGEEEELAQLHNALGFAYFNQNKTEAAIKQYNKAVKLQPGYLTAWNNLGDAQEKNKNSKEAYAAYKEVLALDPNNAIALNRAQILKDRLDRLAPYTNK